MRQQGSLVRFLPSRLVARLSETDSSESWFEGAAVFADIVGFTALTERYAHSGEGGLEKLGGLLNASFARYVDEVHRSGGEVVDFAGDALLAYWPAGPDQTRPDQTGPDQTRPDQTRPDQLVAAAAAAAAGCAARLAALPSDASLGEAPELHVGLGVGKLWAARVGSADHGLHVVLGGPAVREAVAAEKLSAQGEVMLGGTAAKVLSHLPQLARGEFASLQAPAPESPMINATMKQVPPEAWPMGLIPRVVQERWTGSHGRWVSELRRVTPLFVRVEGVDDTRSDALATLQRVSVAIAEVTASFSLESGRFLLDDSGLVFMLVFGIPYDTYADDHPRALRTALAIERKLATLGHSCSMGVASGPAFCGVLGIEDRSGYWTIGPPMNRAARLMSAAQHELFCEASLDDIKDHGDLVAAEVAPLSLKGLTQLNAVRVTQREASDSTRASLVGRAQEQASIERLLSELRDGKGGVLTVVGEAGLGKTALINDLIEKARRRGIVSTIARADPEMTRTYGAWREILRSYLDVPRELPTSELPAWLADPQHHGAQLEHVPLLASLLGVDVDPLPEIHHGAARADAALEALTETIRELAPAPSVIVLEDVHWMDSASFRLAARVAQLLPGVLLVLTMRPSELVGLAEVHRAAEQRSHVIEIKPLDADTCVALACNLFGGRTPPQELLGLIRQHSGGNPLYIVEYLLLLGEALLSTPPSMRGGKSPGPPDSIRALITSRLDRLNPDDTLILRVASVLGARFEWPVLEQLAKLSSPGAPALQPNSLIRQGVLTPLEGSACGYRFSHAMYREVTYDIMLLGQRRTLHAQAAQLLEEQPQPASAATLAHHWQLAGNPERTVSWSEKAGSEALDLGAFEEAAQHFTRCLTDAIDELKARHAIRWHRKLGDAYAGLGALGARAEHARTGLALAGEKPREPLSTSTARAAREFMLSSITPVSGRRTEMDLEIAALYRHVAHVAYFQSDGPGLFSATLRAVRCAERETPSAVLCGALADLGGAVGLGGMHPLGMRYLRRAVNGAEQLEHPHGLAYVHMIKALYLVGRGEWEESEESAERCQELCNSIGDPINWGNAQIVRFWHAHYRGQSALAETLATGLLSRARRTGNQQQATWALRALGLVRLRHGAAAAARPKLESALASARPEDINEFMPTQAALASCYHDLGNSARAHALLDSALTLARSTGRPTGHAVLPGLSAIAKVSLALAAKDPAARPRVKLALERLDAYRRVFPIGLPAYLTWHAQALDQNGNFRAASRAKQQAIEASKRLRMLGELDTEIG